MKNFEEACEVFWIGLNKIFYKNDEGAFEKTLTALVTLKTLNLLNKSEYMNDKEGMRLLCNFIVKTINSMITDLFTGTGTTMNKKIREEVTEKLIIILRQLVEIAPLGYILKNYTDTIELLKRCKEKNISKMIAEPNEKRIDKQVNNLRSGLAKKYGEPMLAAEKEL